MPNCAICGESANHVIDNIHLCGDCNLTMQSGNRDTLMQTLGLLARLAKVNSDETTEALAAYAHEAWACWMRYMFRFGQVNSDGSVTLQADKVERWKRQLETDYADLPEAEKPSDREQAAIILSIVFPYPKLKIPF